MPVSCVGHNVGTAGGLVTLPNVEAVMGQRARLRRVSATVTLEPWGRGDLPLLERLMGDPRMTEHLGGPENRDKLHDRQRRYEHPKGGDRSFKS